MFLSYDALMRSLEAGSISIVPFDPDRCKFASYMLSLNADYTLAPGAFVVGETLEDVQVDDLHCALLFTRGSVARLGVDALMTDCFVEPGWTGKLKLSLINHSRETITLRAGEPIAKIAFSRVVS